MGWDLDDFVFLDDLFNDSFFRHLNNSGEKNELFKFGQELFDDLDLGSQGWAGRSELLDFDQQESDVRFQVLSQEFILLFMSGNLNSNSHAQSLLLDNFVNVFQHFNDLRHDDNFFDDLFQNVRNLNEFFLMADNWNW